MLFVGSDHAGFELKAQILKRLKADGIEFKDLGCDSTDSVDYPDYAQAVSRAVLSEKNSKGLLICGSGLGVAIAANKISGIRAVTVSEPISAALSREHNDAHILCLGARIVGEEVAWACVKAFLSADFQSDHPRHKRRVEKIESFET